MVCFICDAAVNTLRAIQVLRRPAVVKSKLELLFVLEGVRLGDMEKKKKRKKKKRKKKKKIKNKYHSGPCQQTTAHHQLRKCASTLSFTVQNKEKPDLYS